MQLKVKDDVKFFRGLLRELERVFSSQLREQVECCGVSVIQCHTLLEIEQREITTMKEISEFFRIDKSTISRTIDILVKKDLVSRSVNSGNRRFLNIQLTDNGKNLCRNINSICDRFYRDILSSIPSVERGQLLNAFSLFTDALRNADKISDREDVNCGCSDEEGEGE